MATVSTDGPRSHSSDRRGHAGAIESFGIRVVVEATIMTTDIDKVGLARRVLKFATSIALEKRGVS